jgi:hypothetical protein
MDLRAEFQSILRDYGHPVLLLRKDETKRCKCWNDTYGNASKECPICLGLGYLFSLEKHVVRTVIQSIPETLPRINKSIAPAEISIASRIFFTTHDVVAKPGDLVIDVSWNGNKAVINPYTKVYEIGYVEPERGSHGRIEFIKIFSKIDPVEYTFRLQDVIKRYNS